MTFDSASPSIVKSIRQRAFLNAWIRLFAGRRQLPPIEQFEPAGLDDEKPDMMYYHVEHVNGRPYYRVTHEGARLVEFYGFSGLGNYVQDNMGPDLWRHLEPIYQKCLDTGLPTYSRFSVIDVEANEVHYERLLLPFGRDLDVTNLIAFIKLISAERRFVSKDLMRSKNNDPQYSLRAVIDRDLAIGRPVRAPAGDVVEI